MNFCIVDEIGLTQDEIKTLALGASDHLLAYASQWKFSASIRSGVLSASDVPIYITNRNRRVGASGYHCYENGKPAIYVLPNTAYNRYGTWRKALLGLLGKVILPEYKREGTLTTICHEVAEVLSDPLVTTLSAPDSQGRRWLVEIADPVMGFTYMKVINGHKCIFPDIVFPGFYDFNSTKPLSIMNTPTAPFTIPNPLKGYAYWMSKLGLKKV